MAATNFPDWMDATNPIQKGLTPAERQRRRNLKARVCGIAETSDNSLRHAKSTGKLGMGLLRRLVDATEHEQDRVDLVKEIQRQELSRKRC